MAAGSSNGDIGRRAGGETRSVVSTAPGWRRSLVPLIDGGAWRVDPLRRWWSPDDNCGIQTLAIEFPHRCPRVDPVTCRLVHSNDAVAVCEHSPHMERVREGEMAAREAERQCAVAALYAAARRARVTD